MMTMNHQEQFRRIELLLGKESMARLHNAFVVVVGLGAVGGFAVEALARSGVGRLRLVDYDVVKPSNINRQILALWETVDRKKCELAAQRVRAISPDCRVEPLDLFVHTDTLDTVLDGHPDVVIDAIDSLNPKTELLAELTRRNQTAVSSMGAALRTDPTRIRVAPLAEITHCPLAAALRKRLRRRGLEPGFPCVYSDEPIRDANKNAFVPPELSEPNYYNQGRKRATLGSLPTVTGIFGLTVANMAIQLITQERYL